jgi:hypothetical protein
LFKNITGDGNVGRFKCDPKVLLAVHPNLLPGLLLGLVVVMFNVDDVNMFSVAFFGFGVLKRGENT